MKIGDKIWQFQSHHRVYRKPESGRLYPSGGPIYREHWVELEITGETRVSWIVGVWGKCPKKGEHRGWAFTLAEVEDDVFRNDHQWRIADHIRVVRDIAVLRQVADLIGYKPKEDPK